MAKKPDITSIGQIEGSENEINSNFTVVRDAFDNTVSLDGSTPNSMSGDLDMDGNDILNVGDLTVGGVGLSQSVSDAEAAAELAEKWASEAEDVEVESGEFSAFHWAQKAEDEVSGLLRKDTTGELSVGYSHTVHDIGTIASGTVTPDEADGAMQKMVNGGLFTLNPPVNNTMVLLKITNNASADSIGTGNFTIVTGDSFTTTDTEAFLCTLTKIDGSSHLHVTALQ